MTFLFLVSDPRAVGCPSPDHCSDNSPKKNKQGLELLEKARSPDNDVLPDLSLPGEKEVAISFKRALAIPVSFKSAFFITFNTNNPNQLSIIEVEEIEVEDSSI